MVPSVFRPTLERELQIQSKAGCTFVPSAPHVVGVSAKYKSEYLWSLGFHM